MDTNGLVSRPSGFGHGETLDRLEAAIAARGMALFARIDHAAAAVRAGLTMRPTMLLIFGSAKVGTPLMQSAQSIGIDLPLKALVWQDEADKVWLAYNDPHWLAERHGASADMIVEDMAAVLAEVSAYATERDEGGPR